MANLSNSNSKRHPKIACFLKLCRDQLEKKLLKTELIKTNMHIETHMHLHTHTQK